MQARKTLTLLTAVVIGLTSTLAVADPRDRRDDHDRYGQQDRRGGPDRNDRHDNRRDDRRDDRRYVDHGRGAGPDHRWHRGDRLPRDYRVRQVVVNDWRGHHLHAPPRGQQWVQIGADYALIAIATGVIAQIILAR